MAPKKKPYSELSDSAKYLRKNKKARDKKKEERYRNKQTS